MHIWRITVIDGIIESPEETDDEKDLLQFEAHRRQKTVHKDMRTITHMLIAADTESEARLKAYSKWAGVLSREQNVYRT